MKNEKIIDKLKNMKYVNFNDGNKLINYDYDNKSINERIERIEYYFKIDLTHINGYYFAFDSKHLSNDEWEDLQHVIDELNNKIDELNNKRHELYEQFKMCKRSDDEKYINEINKIEKLLNIKK